MNHQILPEHIRASLAQYSEHQECTCLSCGYSGLMGVHKKEQKINNKNALLIFAVIMGLLVFYSLAVTKLPWWIGIIVGLGIGAYSSMEQIYLACPNCNAVLKIK